MSRPRMEAMRRISLRRHSPLLTAARALWAISGLIFAAGCNAEKPPADAAPDAERATLIVCSQFDDADRTRLVLGLDADNRQVTRFEIVTPDFIWRIPGQPETRRFPAGESDASPDLAGRLRFSALNDARGGLRLLDFASPTPDAVQLEGLRGSFALHEAWQNRRAPGSLYYAATGNLVEIVALACQRIDEG